MSATLMSARGRTVTISRYGPGQHQPRHADQHSRISLVLRGDFEEESGSRRLGLAAGDVLLKSCRVTHEDRFGGAGALILSLAYVQDDPFEADAPLWRRLDVRGVARVAASLLEAALARDPLALDAAAGDLLAARQGTDEPSAQAPAWLRRLRQELEGASLATVDVAARARDAGVHAAHASRLFRRCFGTSITEYAQAHAVRRALGLMADPAAALSEVAQGAGFYDQSHMSRVFGRVSGRAPGAHRALLGRAAALAG